MSDCWPARPVEVRELFLGTRKVVFETFGFTLPALALGFDNADNAVVRISSNRERWTGSGRRSE